MPDRDEATTRTAVYCRISLDQTGQALGVSRQLEDCAALAEKQGWTITEVYTDNDISAASGKPRPEYRRLMADIEQGKVDALIAWSPDRLYRRLNDLEKLIPIIESNGVHVRTVKAGDLDLTSAYGRMIARILGAVASGEGEIKAERWKRSWRQHRESGARASTGSRLFGYTRHLEPIPDEAAIARKMADDVLSGIAISAIARDLNARGILATRGNDWRPAGVRVYLANPKIAGYSTIKGEIVGTGDWEPIIDRETWENVRALLDSRSRPGPPPRVALLGGLIFCGGCGFRMITSRSKAGRSYRCPSRPGLQGCGRISGAAQPIEDVIETFARVLLDQPETRQRIAALQSSTGSVALAGEATALEARILELEAELDTPGIPVASILRAIDRAKTRLEDVHRELGATADVRGAQLPEGGMPWPSGLIDRRRLCVVALGDLRVYLDPRISGWPNTKGFDLRRIRLARELDERPGVALS